MTFDYIQNGNSYTVFSNPSCSSNYYAYSIPDSPLNILEYGNSIYLLDIEKQEIRKLLNDNAGGYHIENTCGNLSGEFCWGANGSINPDGTKFIFVTNRKALKDYPDNLDLCYEIWVKDMKDGSEKPLCSHGYERVLAWDKEDNVYFSENGSRCIYKLNLDDGSKSIVADNIDMADGSFPYIIYYRYGQNPVVLNLMDGSQKEFDSLKYDSIENFKSMPDNENILITVVPNRSEFRRDLVVLNMKTLQYKILAGDNDKMLENWLWYDRDTFLVTVQKNSGDEPVTYSINLDELR